MSNIEQAKGCIDSDSKVGSEKNGNSPKDASESASTRSRNGKGRLAKIKNHKYFKACWELVTWTPKRCRWDPESPPTFSLGLNLLFGFVSLPYFWYLFYFHLFPLILHLRHK